MNIYSIDSSNPAACVIKRVFDISDATESQERLISSIITSKNTDTLLHCTGTLEDVGGIVPFRNLSSAGFTITYEVINLAMSYVEFIQYAATNDF